jgi:hypothetical protein
MENSKAVSELIKKDVEQNIDDSAISPRLDNDGERAAGWLSEALSTVNSVAPTPVTASANLTQPVSSLGDAILRGMQSASQNYKKVSGEIHDSLSDSLGENMSLRGALQLHMKFVEVSMEAEVVSRVVSKSTQHIDQLSKLQ